MTDIVDSSEIEDIVGTSRHPILHYGRVVDESFYIMHSQYCLDKGEDLRECAFSKALDTGIVHSPDGYDSPRVLAVGKDGGITTYKDWS